ncbi:MAG: hypothetical protein CGU28_05320 [Candidatus Dactylopiibacterium carminicum]|uniref:Uncharacterized protein n=1 Tax=Candidatus Dactylopiibacterium carminicum TaxID=857335 RepID=A0A272ETS5_9RHOO|nr:hypothetical protein [Candidatus Dactylopiibacterium carminicum]KAF7599465.1 hypothetical protein BGI27_07850 [Candidatus Dactylopiibacterium carminicum]PAS93492.1 MAG: hypothetical protein CGU29_07390 [Candidatus Dactylopiibacterium carminicum]PAS97338.1 MAG: hypothetical protein CGU28_05320 [Candidatus Dactylopiibacterium carminicum]PAS99473.1 MAG: hypothetical protein BSR46_07875 [Candidatus Dactylopiibacterium carminicum]
MSNKVKWMHNAFAGAPVLTNNWGSLTALLDACIVTGFNLKTVTALARTGEVATATIGTGHGFVVDQVVLVEGCDQPSYNGEFTVTAITSTTVSFRVDVDGGEPASPATTQTSITMKIAPLGFETVFTGTNKRAYRSPNPLSNRHYLRVDDSLPEGYTTTWAKFARVTIAEGMADIDTFVGAQAPFTPGAPTRNEVPSGSGTAMYTGWFKWYYARSTAYENNGDSGAAARSWVLIGDDRGFFLANSSGLGGDKRVLHAFTDFDSYRPGDNFASYLIATENYSPTGSGNYFSYPSQYAYSAYSLDTTGKICLRDYTGIGGNVRIGMLSLNDQNGQNVSGRSAAIPFPNGPDYGLIIHPIYLRESGGHLRGTLPGIFWVHQNQPYGHLTKIDNVIGYEDRKFLYVTVDYGSEGNTSGFMFDITGPWRH